MTKKRAMAEGGTPETAAWLLYAGLVQALRWQKHVTAVAPVPAAAPRRAVAVPRVAAERAPG